MNPEHPAQKRALRQQLGPILKQLTDEQRRAGSACACALLRKQPVWHRAKSVLLYMPFHVEIDVLPLIEAALTEGKTVALPRFVEASGIYEARQVTGLRQDCAPGKFGIPEPGHHCPVFSLKHLDLVVTPGVGFDAAGHRLGRGKGFYDRILAEVTGVKCGAGFDEQIVEHVPAEAHDVRLNCIVTPTRWMEIVD